LKLRAVFSRRWFVHGPPLSLAAFAIAQVCFLRNSQRSSFGACSNRMLAAFAGALDQPASASFDRTAFEVSRHLAPAALDIAAARS
jgi:hypothetical protein